MMNFCCLIIALVGLLASGVASTERRLGLTTGTRWQRGQQVPGDTPLHAVVFLTQSNIDLATNSLMAMSDPSSRSYGQHWTAQEVARALAPSTEHVDLVLEWLVSSNIRQDRIKRSHSGDQLHFPSTASELGQLLNTSYYYFRDRSSSDGGDIQIACDAYSVPQSLSNLIDYITPTLPQAQGLTKRHKSVPSLTTTRRRATLPPALADCRLFTQASCIRDLYNIPPSNALPPPHDNNTFGIFELTWVTWRPEDLDAFFAYFDPQHLGRRPVVEPINGGYLQYDYNFTVFNLEADLDFQYAMALTHPSQPITNIQVGDKFTTGNLNHMLAAFDKYYCGALDPTLDKTSAFPNPKPGGHNKTIDCGTATPPKVISLSYSWSESDFPPAYLRRQCLEFLKLGLMGVSVIVSSGDTGVESGIAPGTCITSDPTNPSKFSPQWPASCPWVTVVGGTQLTTQTTNTNTPPPPPPPNTPINETVFRASAGPNDEVILSSSGGFSNVFSTPIYQLPSVSSYLLREKSHFLSTPSTNTTTPQTINTTPKFNPHGRGYPDISALASTYLAVVDDKLITAFGTSASTPVFAAMISLINNERLHQGKRTLGFINPALYASAMPDHLGGGGKDGKKKVFNDIVTGANEGCGAAEAFRAAEGWDAVSGLGSVDFGGLREVFLRLP